VYPDDLKYTAEHEWVRVAGSGAGSGAGSDADTIRIGITDYAQDALGDIVYVQLPELGAELTAGEPCGEIESTKSVSDVYAPVSGVVVARNEQLDTTPEAVNSDPYGDGWLLEIKPASAADVDGLLDAAAYQATISGS
jgi:glycine cleavage system H protein